MSNRNWGVVDWIPARAVRDRARQREAAEDEFNPHRNIEIGIDVDARRRLPKPPEGAKEDSPGQSAAPPWVSDGY
jgi:hypothetical protein